MTAAVRTRTGSEAAVRSNHAALRGRVSVQTPTEGVTHVVPATRPDRACDCGNEHLRVHGLLAEGTKDDVLPWYRRTDRPVHRDRPLDRSYPPRAARVQVGTGEVRPGEDGPLAGTLR